MTQYQKSRLARRLRVALKEIEQLSGYGVRHDLDDAIAIARAALANATTDTPNDHPDRQASGHDRHQW
jgi:hypothetical protein